MSKKYTRGIDNKGFFNNLGNSSILKTVKNDPDLFLGIRNNYVNIYYEGASLAKISYINNNFRFSIAQKYLPNPKPNTKSCYIISYTEMAFIKDIVVIKNKIHDFQYKINNQKCEKLAQQKLILDNNKNRNSNWFCVDMEYNMQRKSSSQQNFGRFDIVAISKTKPHRIALIELKYGCGAYNGNYEQLRLALSDIKYINNKGYILTTDYNYGSGIFGHVCDYIRYKNSGNISTLKSEIIQICNNYSELVMMPHSLNLKNIVSTDFSEEPEVYFITIGGKISTEKMQMKKYLLSKSKCKDSSIYNIEDILGVDISVQNNLFNPIFLFCDYNITNLNIDDIIDDPRYSKGL